MRLIRVPGAHHGHESGARCHGCAALGTAPVGLAYASSGLLARLLEEDSVPGARLDLANVLALAEQLDPAVLGARDLVSVKSIGLGSAQLEAPLELNPDLHGRLSVRSHGPHPSSLVMIILGLLPQRVKLPGFWAAQAVDRTYPLPGLRR